MLSQLKSHIEQVVGEVELEENRKKNLYLADVEAVEQDVQLSLAWDRDAHYLVGQVDCDKNTLGPIARACSSFGSELECGSILLEPQVNVKVMEQNGYEKQYIFPLSLQAASRVYCERLQKKGHECRSFLELTLARDITYHLSHDERPHILSLDWKGENFSLYLHVHSVTQAAYLEELVVPKSLRYQGIGTTVVNYLKDMLLGINCRYLYLSAKKRAEGFWESQGFSYLLRANLRNERRRKKALRRVPGWDRAYFEGERLPEPTWAYRNHPQDDLDLFLAIRNWPLNSGSPISLTEVSG